MVLGTPVAVATSSSMGAEDWRLKVRVAAEKVLRLCLTARIDVDQALIEDAHREWVDRRRLDSMLSGVEKKAAQLLREQRIPQIPPSHSDDFSTVLWDGRAFTFETTQQRIIVEALWKEWEEGRGGLHRDHLAELCDSEAKKFRLDQVFRVKGGRVKERHPAWLTMIQRVGRSMFALCPPRRAPK